MRPLPLLLLLSGLLAATTAWSAPRIPAVAAPPLVREGAEYETVVPALPPGVDEFELFLLVEDGPRRLVRLTPECEGAAGPLRWRMPRVGAARARLVLRAGGRFGESESEPSASFPVEAAGPRERAELLRAGDELARHFGGDDAPAPALLPPDATTIGATTHGLTADGPARSPVARPPATEGRFASRPGPVATTTPTLPERSRRPARIPLQN